MKFDLSEAANVEIKFVLQGQVYKDLTASGVAGDNRFVVSDFDRELVVGTYAVVVTATSGGETAQLTGTFTVTK